MGGTPETRYARTADGVHIAYQVVSDDGPDLLLSQGFISHVELLWDYPPAADLLRRLASFSRLITFDKRGVGMSDRGVGFPTVEERTDDITAVIDAVGGDSVHLLGESEGGPTTMQFAATHPERVRSLLLYGTFARVLEADDYEIGVSPEVFGRVADAVEDTWGRPEALAVYKLWEPDADDDPQTLQQLLQWHRRSASPREAGDALRRTQDVDVRGVLSSITAPTLVLHREGDIIAPITMGRYLAEQIPGARLVELPGREHTPWAGDVDAFVHAIEEWVTGAPVAPPAPRADRVLATVLFTDIVGSTARAATLGDHAWRQQLDRHDALVTATLERFRGTRVKQTGDGVLATFDGPGRAVLCAHALVDALRSAGMDIRAGVHVGEVERRGDDIGGIAVHIGARVAALAAAGEVLVTSTVRDLVTGSDLRFEERGEEELKGVPGRWLVLASTAP